MTGSVSVSAATDAGEWNAFVASHPDATADHRWEWRTIFKEVFHQEPLYLLARRNGRVAGVLPLVKFRSRLFGRSLVSLPFLNYGGVLTADTDARAALLRNGAEAARDFGAAHLELRHRDRQFAEQPCRQHKLQLTRTLAATSDELWAGLDKKVRNQVRKAQKDGLTTESGGSELVDAFYEVFAANMRDLGTPVYAKPLFSQTLRLFPQDAQVHVVRLGSTAVAAAITIAHGDSVLVPWASSLREFRQHCPNMLLYWTMLDAARQRGARVFDFGRSSPGSGTHHFKLQWGATERPLHWEYVMLNGQAPPDHGPQNPKFAKVIEVWQRMPLWFTNSVGPLIVRNIP